MQIPAGNCEEILKSPFIQRQDPEYSLHALQIVAENPPTQRHNSFMLENIANKLFSIPAKSEIQKNVHFRYFRVKI